MYTRQELLELEKIQFETINTSMLQELTDIKMNQDMDIEERLDTFFCQINDEEKETANEFQFDFSDIKKMSNRFQCCQSHMWNNGQSYLHNLKWSYVNGIFLFISLA